MPELPKRRKIQNNQGTPIKRQFTYREFLTQEIPSNQVWSIVLSEKDLDLDMSKFIKLIHTQKITIWCLDYNSVIFLNSILKEKVSNLITLVDDGLRIPREYIDLTKLENITVRIPLTYLMWGVKFNDEVKTYSSRSAISGEIHEADYSNTNKILTLENLKRIKVTLQNLARHNPKDTTEKVYLVSDYIQSKTQFIEGYESVSARGTFVTPSYPELCPGLVETVNNHEYGVCVGIANLSTMLLNNPLLNTETETTFGCNHAWNKVLIDGKYYYFDTTWNITRSSNSSETGLITLSFQRKYLLFGTKTAQSIGHHIPQNLSIYNNGVMSEEDYQKLVSYNSRFNYNQEPHYKSFKK